MLPRVLNQQFTYFRAVRLRNVDMGHRSLLVETGWSELREVNKIVRNHYISGFEIGVDCAHCVRSEDSFNPCVA
jgi:hypothetical protein